MEKGIVRKIDEMGRITLPIEIRRTFDLKPGDRVGIALDGQALRMAKDIHGMTRPVDHLGRIALPIEYRRTLGLEEHQKVDMYIEGNDICIEKVGCIFCGSSEGLIEVEGIQICRKHALAIHDKVMEG